MITLGEVTVGTTDACRLLPYGWPIPLLLSLPIVCAHV